MDKKKLNNLRENFDNQIFNCYLHMWLVPVLFQKNIGKK